MGWEKEKADRIMLNEAIQYFTENKGFTRLMRGMMAKYRSLGHWGGSVKLTGLKEEEREALGAFFRKDFSRQKSATIYLEDFAKALEQTRFGEIPPLALLEGIAGEPLQGKKEEIAQKEKAKEEFFARFTSSFPHEYCQIWLQAIKEKERGTRPVHMAYDREPNTLKVQLGYILKALCRLPRPRVERLSVFARQITKDPHGFDQNNETGRLLIHALRYLRDYYTKIGQESLTTHETQETEKSQDTQGSQISQGSQASQGPQSILTGAEELSELYYSFGLLRDDLWNFVTCTGLIAYSGSEGVDTHFSRGEDESEYKSEPVSRGEAIPYLASAYTERVTLNLPLREIVKLGKVIPGDPKLDRVYVVENSGVFSALIDHFEDYCEKAHKETLEMIQVEASERPPNPPLICTHGQFKLASLLLLDKLAASGIKIFYSGDFDPEGILMLDRLKQRYSELLIPWHYSLKDYRTC
ncbi:MAG: DUF2399 domain-containing protein, partial [Desulfitobacterium sp.]|nr:DUF2399 domain-containing protein [Desulfitobacterium sp.]